MTQPDDMHPDHTSLTVGGAAKTAARSLRSAIDALAELQGEGPAYAGRRTAAVRNVAECRRRLARALAELQERQKGGGAHKNTS